MISKSFFVVSAIVLVIAVLTCYADDDHDPFCPYPSDEITYYPFPGDCSQYIECYEGYKYYMKCPSDLYWNQAVSNCDYECNTSEVPSEGTTTPHGNYDPDCPDSGTYYYPHYSNCEKFYQCRNGYKLILHCTSGYAYSYILNTCDLKEHVDCSYTTNSPVTTQGSHTTIDYNNCPSTGTTYLPNFANCSKFYECNDGEKTELSCQSDYAWDILLSTCAEKEYVDCGYTTQGHETTAPTEGPRTTIDYNNCPSTGTIYLPNFTNCSKFYECNEGVKTELSCQADYAWDISLSTCVRKEDVDCSYVTGQPVATTTTPQIGPETTSPTDGPRTTIDYNNCPSTGTIYLPNFANCSKFYECNEGVKTELSCQAGYAWDISLSTCAKKEDVDCSYVTGQPVATTTTPEIDRTTTAYTSNTKTTTKTTSAPSDHKCANKPDGTLLAVDGDDTKYIECANGRDIIMSCAPGTTFDEAAGICD